MSNSEETVVIQTEEETTILQEQPPQVTQEELAIMEQEMLLFQSSESESSDSEFEPSDSSDDDQAPRRPIHIRDFVATVERERRKVKRLLKLGRRLARKNQLKESRLNETQQYLMDYNQRLKRKNVELNKRACLLKAKEEQLAIRESLLEQAEHKK